MGLWRSNFEANLPYLSGFPLERCELKIESCTGDALIVAAGPSIKNDESKKLELIRGFKGMIYATDGILAEMLKRKIYPHYVCSVDSDPIIADLYGENTHTYHMLLAATVHPSVKEKFSSLRINWFMPEIDDPNIKGSMTNRALVLGIPVIKPFGNVGACLYNIATWMHDHKRIGLVGFDYSYPDLDFKMTQYYSHLMDITNGDEEKAKSLMLKVYNPITKKHVWTDPVYYSYRDAFRKMFRMQPLRVQKKTWNLTGDGILFGASLKWGKLEEWVG